MVVYRVEHSGGRVRYINAAAYEIDAEFYDRVTFYEDAEKTTPKAFFNRVDNVESWGRVPKTLPVVREVDSGSEPGSEVLPQAEFLSGISLPETPHTQELSDGDYDEVPF